MTSHNCIKRVESLLRENARLREESQRWNLELRAVLQREEDLSAKLNAALEREAGLRKAFTAD